MFKIKDVLQEDTFNQLFHIFNAKVGTRNIDEEMLEQLFIKGINISNLYEFLNEINDDELKNRYVGALVQTTRK